MKDFILERSLINANNVASVLAKQDILRDTQKSSILERSLINANNVASILAKQEI